MTFLNRFAYKDIVIVARNRQKTEKLTAKRDFNNSTPVQRVWLHVKVLYFICDSVQYAVCQGVPRELVLQTVCIVREHCIIDSPVL